MTPPFLLILLTRLDNTKSKNFIIKKFICSLGRFNKTQFVKLAKKERIPLLKKYFTKIVKIKLKLKIKFISTIQKKVKYSQFQC